MSASLLSNIILDGKVIPVDDARVRLSSRLAMYGEGCFDTIRAYEGGFLHPEKHLARLHKGITFLGWETPEPFCDMHAFMEIMTLFLKSNRVMDQHVRIRVQVWADDHTSGYIPGSASTRVLIAGSLLESGGKNRIKPVSLGTSQYRRIPASALPPEVKWTNGINYILAARDAQKKQVDDALMLTHSGFVSETTIANIFWKTSGTIFTPSEDCDLLPGVTRSVLLEIFERSGIPLETGSFSLKMLADADSAWVCNSVREICPVARLDDHRFAPDTEFMNSLSDQFDNYKREHIRYAR